MFYKTLVNLLKSYLFKTQLRLKVHYMRKHYYCTDKSCKLNVSYEIIESEDLIFETFDGQASLSNLIQCDSYLIEDPEYRDHYNVLTYIKEAEVIMSFVEVPMFLEFFNSIPGLPTKKVACVFNAAEYQLFSTILKANHSKLKIDVKFFKTLKQALLWLKKTSLESSLLSIIEESKSEHRLVS